MDSEQVTLQPRRAHGDIGPGWIFIAVSLAITTIAVAVSDDGWVPILDSANLVFHEAGHPIFGLLGETFALYGGTLGQLAFPVTAIITFWRQQHSLGLMLAWVWLFQNFLNIARYMADARKQELPLVGGGDHDWTNILSRWGALSSDTSLAGGLEAIAWLGLFGVWAWVAKAWMQRH